MELDARRLPHNPLFHSGTLSERSSREAPANGLENLGPLTPLLQDPTITEILVTGPSSIVVERLGRIERAPLTFQDAPELLRIVQTLAGQAGARLDARSPLLDSRLPDGTRISVMIPPLAIDGPVLTLRRCGSRLRSLDLVALGVVPRDILEFLEAAVVARMNVLIFGEPGCGKTTLLNALCRSIPHSERIVTIESGIELHLDQPNVIRLDARYPKKDPNGVVAMIRQSLQCRPDRVILGDARGPEAWEVWQAAASGSGRMLMAMTAGDSRHLLARLESLAQMTGEKMPRRLVRRYLTATPTILVHLIRVSGSGRRVARVAELLRSRRRCKLRSVFAWKPSNDRWSEGVFRCLGRVPRCLPAIRSAGIEIPETLFARRDIGGLIS